MLARGALGGFGVRCFAIVAGLGLCATMLVASAPARAASTICTGRMDGVEITGNLTVPPGASCRLLIVTVEGNVSVGQGAVLDADQAFGQCVGP